jgi:hypothetical protein
LVEDLTRRSPGDWDEMRGGRRIVSLGRSAREGEKERREAFQKRWRKDGEGVLGCVAV